MQNFFFDEKLMKRVCSPDSGVIERVRVRGKLEGF
jgi:hypothetical protein